MVLISVQHALGLMTGVGTTDGNQVVTDMDGGRIATDELLFVDEPEQISAMVESPLVPAQKEELDVLLHEYGDVFEEKPAGGARVEPMEIRWKPEWKFPSMQGPRKYSPRVEAAIELDLAKQLENGVVEPSDADYGCPVHAVPKPDSDSGYRFTVDFREINSGVVTDGYPLPTVDYVLSSLAGSRFFAKMDLRYGYWQFPVCQADRKFLSFFWTGKIRRVLGG